MRKRLLIWLLVLALPAPAAAACDSSGPEVDTPGLAPRGTVMTTVKPTRQELANRVSLSGTVTLNPVFGLVAPVDGQVRYESVRIPRTTPTKPTRVATVWAKGKARPVRVPAGAIFSGRLVDDRSAVRTGMPIVSAKHVGYGIVADIDGTQAYKISSALSTVRAQIANGPGPFGCRVRGTIAALPEGTIPEPPTPTVQQSASPGPPPEAMEPDRAGTAQPSEATGMRVVCVPPADVRLINGASVTLEVITARAANALVLPVEAVAGGQGRGQVDVVGRDGARQTRQVRLGLTDGKVIQITSGLTEADTVAVPGPDLPVPEPGDADPRGGVVTK